MPIDVNKLTATPNTSPDEDEACTWLKDEEEASVCLQPQLHAAPVPKPLHLLWLVVLH